MRTRVSSDKPTLSNRAVLPLASASKPSCSVNRAICAARVIYQGIRRDTRDESRSFERSRGGYQGRDSRSSDSASSSSSYDHSSHRYEPRQEYTREPRRTIQKVSQDSEWIYGTSVVEAALMDVSGL